MSDPSTPHARLDAQLRDAGLPYSAAEAHGILCGLTCAGVANWQEALLDEAAPPELVEHLQAHFDQCQAELEARRMPVELLLPDDEQPVAVRATALRDWCQGFLYGFGLGGRLPEGFEQSEAGEALRDFGEIARMDLGDFGDDQQAEEALMQLREYLWVAASLIWHARHHDTQ